MEYCLEYDSVADALPKTIVVIAWTLGAKLKTIHVESASNSTSSNNILTYTLTCLLAWILVRENDIYTYTYLK